MRATRPVEYRHWKLGPAHAVNPVMLEKEMGGRVSTRAFESERHPEQGGRHGNWNWLISWQFDVFTILRRIVLDLTIVYACTPMYISLFFY